MPSRTASARSGREPRCSISRQSSSCTASCRRCAIRDTITFKQQFREVDVLMIDDVQFIAGKDTTQEEFFHTFNALIDQNKQIVISADRSPDQIENLQNRILSRLQWGLVADIHPTDYELRLGILQSKAERIMDEDPDRPYRPQGAGVPGAPDQFERARAGRGADPAVRVRDPGQPADQPGHGAGMPGRPAALVRAQGHDRGDQAPGGRVLLAEDDGPDLGPAGPGDGPAPAGGDVSLQDADVQEPARDRARLSAGATTPP